MKRLIVFIWMLVSLVCLRADVMRNYFRDCPDDFFLMLTHNNKLDMLDFMDSKMAAVVKNIYGEQSQLLELNDDYLRIRTSAASMTEMKLLTIGRDTLICVVKTLYAPEPESEISFIATATMKPAGPTKRFVDIPKESDFFIVPEGRSKTDLSQAVSQMDVTLVSAGLDATAPLIRFRLSYGGGFLENKEEVGPFVKKEIVARWNGKKFVRVK